MKTIVLFLWMLLPLCMTIASCNPDDNPDNTMNKNIIIAVGNSLFTVNLENNEASNAFAAMLPITVTMNDMNHNEKYHYLSDNLPTFNYRPGTIQNGDLMLYGSNCLVLFYKTFSSPYSYTRLGRVSNPDGLAAALGNDNITVTFKTN